MPKLPVFEVRKCRAGDLSTLEKVLPSGGYHHKRFNDQQNGTSTYLIAWQNKNPVGHVNIIWGGTQKPKVRPMLNAMEVAPKLRSQGIGAKLLSAVEEIAKGRGFKQVELMVDVANSRAKRFYERDGFKDPGFGVETMRWPKKAGDKNSPMVEKKCRYLIKDL